MRFRRTPRKEQDGALLDRLTGDFGIFIARIEQISAVWDLLSTVPSKAKSRWQNG